jgi:two-component system, chemotaxis family, protein-glutamate methylesterase/glutaminase
MPVHGGQVLVAPGGRHLELRAKDGKLSVETPVAGPDDRYSPSVDRLFSSVARILGSESLGVVLTGMGEDGARGASAIRRVGGEVWAESQESAAVFGMPSEAIATGAVSRVLALDELGAALLTRAKRRR